MFPVLAACGRWGLLRVRALLLGVPVFILAPAVLLVCVCWLGIAPE